MKRQIVMIALNIGLLVLLVLIGSVRSQNAKETNIPEARAQAVLDRHRPDLLKIPDVATVMPMPVEGKIHVQAVLFTDAKGERPAVLPPAITAFPKEIEGVPVALAIKYVLPPPPGVIVVKSGGEHFRADTCPPGTIETEHLRWHFCLDANRPEAIPAVMVPPIAGIPYEEAFKILERHRAELQALPGVGSIGMGAKGISISAKNPSVIPKEVEGLPVQARPFVEEIFEMKSHTTTGTWHPLRGALNIGVYNRVGDRGVGTSTGVVYEGGGMWLIFPAHLIPYPECTNPVYRCTAPNLSECRDRYPKSAPRVEASLLSQGGRVANVVKWTQQGEPTTRDVAAAWIDNGDRVMGDASTCANTTIEGKTFPVWSGLEASRPQQGDALFMYCSYDPHIRSVVVDEVDVSYPNIVNGCIPSLSWILLNQVTMSAGVGTFQQGCSGSPILTFDDKIVAFLSWGRFPPLANFGGGLYAPYIKQEIGFSKWYGSSTFPNNSQVCQ
jgi:hypothetical protein